MASCCVSPTCHPDLPSHPPPREDKSLWEVKEVVYTVSQCSQSSGNNHLWEGRIPSYKFPKSTPRFPPKNSFGMATTIFKNHYFAIFHAPCNFSRVEKKQNNVVILIQQVKLLWKYRKDSKSSIRGSESPALWIPGLEKILEVWRFSPPDQLHMEPENAPFLEKEKHRPKLSILGSILVFRG